MRKFLLHIALTLCATTVLFSCRTTDAVAQQPTAITFNVFYSELSPYGVWVQDPQYGYVWVPDVPGGFQPYYSNGYWVMTEYGNTWVSGYSWGWAPFHYGRWLYDAFYGWVWVPGYDWGPAWVYWRYGAGYYGWTPLAPGFVVTASFGMYNCPADWWIFLPPKYLYRRNFTTHVRDRRNNLTVINRTTVINNTYINRQRNTTYITGPSAENYRQVAGRDVTMHSVTDVAERTSSYTRGSSVRMYRPEVRPADETAAPPSPLRAEQPVREPVPVSTHDGREVPFSREIERTRPSRQPMQQPEPVQRTPQRTEPAQRTPQRTEPAQRTPQRTEPAQRTPQRTEPAQRTPQRTEPAQRAPQRTEPAQRTPQRSEPTQRSDQPARRP